MQSALQMALRDITTLPKSRSGGEESDGSEVCLALLIVSSPPFLLYSALDLLGKRSLCREQEQGRGTRRPVKLSRQRRLHAR